MLTIGFLIPTTSRKMEWTSPSENNLFTMFIPSLLKTISNDSNLKYIIYIGIDFDDQLLNNQQFDHLIQSSIKDLSNISYKIIIFEQFKKYHLTTRWNHLFQIAFDDQCDYFYQCGDDIIFMNHGWINESIKLLQMNDNLGISGPLDIDQKNSIIMNRIGLQIPSDLLTQCMLSRKHYLAFGFLFNPRIRNWWCDTWLNEIYKPNMIYRLENYFYRNAGGNPRYKINIKDRTKWLLLANRDKDKLDNYLKISLSNTIIKNDSIWEANNR